MGTTLYVNDDVKDRFDSFRRRLEAERDEDMTSGDVLTHLLDEVEDSD